jgi:hypothetical protein
VNDIDGPPTRDRMFSRICALTITQMKRIDAAAAMPAAS